MGVRSRNFNLDFGYDLLKFGIHAPRDMSHDNWYIGFPGSMTQMMKTQFYSRSISMYSTYLKQCLGPLRLWALSYNAHEQESSRKKIESPDTPWDHTTHTNMQGLIFQVTQSGFQADFRRNDTMRANLGFTRSSLFPSQGHVNEVSKEAGNNFAIQNVVTHSQYTPK